MSEQVEMQKRQMESNSVRISEDGLEAWLYLCNKADGSSYSKDEIKKILLDHQVKFGYLESNIAAMAKKGIYKREVKIAVGVPVVPGQNGYYEYFVETEDFSKHPKINADGSVNYQSMYLLQNVKKGQKLALYHEAVEGVKGMTVKGIEIIPQPVKDLLPLRGKGFKNTEDPNYYIAETDGKLSFNNGKMEIRNVHEVSGDVDMITGRIEFFGDIVINGSVAAGVVIRSGKTLTITGTVEAVNITAAGDVVLKRGIQGNEKAKIVTKGNVYADFIEHTTIEAKGSVFANTILNSKVHADGNVTLTGKRGTVIGGYTHGFLGISAASIGSESEVKTILHSGCEESVFLKNLDLQKKEAIVIEEYNDVIEDLKIAFEQQKKKNFAGGLENRIKKLKQQELELKQQLKQYQEEREKVLTNIENGKLSKIQANGNIYRNSVICINNAYFTLEQNNSFMEYKSESGIIIGNVIVRK